MEFQSNLFIFSDFFYKMTTLCTIIIWTFYQYKLKFSNKLEFPNILQNSILNLLFFTRGNINDRVFILFSYDLVY